MKTEELYKEGWRDEPSHGYATGARLVSIRDDLGGTMVSVSMGILSDSAYLTVRLPDATDLALSRRVADAMAAAALDVVTAYRAGNEERCHV